MADRGPFTSESKSELGEDDEIDLRANPFRSPRVVDVTPRVIEVTGHISGEAGDPDQTAAGDEPAADGTVVGDEAGAPDEVLGDAAVAETVATADVEEVDIKGGQAEASASQMPLAPLPTVPDQIPDTPVQAEDDLSLTEPGAISRAATWLFLPAFAALFAAAVLAAVLVAYAHGRTSAADNIDRSIQHERSVQASADEVWSGLLGLAASGVGQEVITTVDVVKQIGEATADRPGPRPAGADASDLLSVAQRSHKAFIDAAAKVIEIDDGAPLSVANELSDLSSRHAAMSGDHDRYIASLSSTRGGLHAASDLWSGVALVVFVAGLALSGVLTLRARRRALSILDEPARSSELAVRRVAMGDVSARSGVGSVVGVGAVALSIDSSLDTISHELEGLRNRAEWGERSAMIFEALDDAQDEAAAYVVVERALSLIDEDHHPVELMISERGSSRIRPVAADPEATGSPHIVVDTTGVCLAMRRGQVSISRSSNSINACPMIRDRPGGPCSSACVPISVGGRPIGVFHMIGPEFQPPSDVIVSRLVSLSVQLGNRLGALRALESSRKEAATDGLTGLPNRRMLQTEVARLLEADTPFVMVLADLDKFKRLNDTYGHEVGDKALKLFAEVLKKNVRGNDLVARIGGEEFVLVYPTMSVKTSIEAIGRLRQALASAVATSPLPSFTCSFGVSDSNSGTDGEAILRVADAGLLKAKELGGDQAVYAEPGLVEEIFGAGSDRPTDGGSDRR